MEVTVAVTPLMAVVIVVAAAEALAHMLTYGGGCFFELSCRLGRQGEGDDSDECECRTRSFRGTIELVECFHAGWCWMLLKACLPHRKQTVRLLTTTAAACSWRLIGM